MPTPVVPPTRYALVGVGSRSEMFSGALLGDYRDRHRLVAICDSNPGRLDFQNKKFNEKYGIKPLPAYSSADFELMIREQKVQTVIITTIDRAHHEYIIRSVNSGCDVIVEKPLTIDAGKCSAVHAAIRQTGRKVRATFNCRYMPIAALIKEALSGGAIGDVLSVHLEWALDTRHGADYFRRWHRDIRNSGGLMVHKASHHFDLVNWWIGSQPETVFGFGDLRFYGKANAESRGDYRPYAHATGNPAAAGDPYALVLDGHDREMYIDNERYDGYRRDQNVFGDGISIQDDMAVTARYRNGATLTYHLTAYSPWEGWRCMFNGTKGRLEAVCEDNAFVTGSKDPRLNAFGAPLPRQAEAVRRILVRPLWEKPYEIPIPAVEGAHGGGDRRMLDDIFIGGSPDPLGQAADQNDGTWSILLGIAANQSFASGRVIQVDDLVPGFSRGPRL